MQCTGQHPVIPKCVEHVSQNGMRMHDRSQGHGSCMSTLDDRLDDRTVLESNTGSNQGRLGLGPVKVTVGCQNVLFTFY
jgi:hypothetical protein